MRSKTTFTFEDEAIYKSFLAAGARKNEIFNLKILKNVVIFSEVEYKKSTYIQTRSSMFFSQSTKVLCFFHKGLQHTKT